MRVLTAAAWFSLAVAAVDAAVAATPWSDHWRTIGAALRSIPWVILLSLGVAAAGAALLKLLLRRSERADDAVAALLAAGAVGFSVLRWFGMVGALRRPFSHGAEIATAAAAAGVTAAAVWWSGRDAHRFDSLGLVAVVGAAACWTGVYSTSAPAGRYGVWLAGAVLAAVAWQAFAKLPKKTQASAGAAAVAALAGAGFLAARSPGAYFQPVQDAPLSQADGPPILLLSIDTLRWESVSFLNPDAPKTPHLDSLAADSLVFERAYSSGSWTLTSMASALTGMHARTHQLDGEEKWIVPAQAALLAETLSEAGYRTAAAADNPWLQATGGFARGMESFAHFPRSSESIGSRLDRKLGPDTTATLTWLAREWIAEHAHETFFFWLHYFDPHAPYEPPKAYRPAGPPPAGESWSFGEVSYVNALREMMKSGGYEAPSDEHVEWVRRLYSAEVAYVDAEVGGLLADLRASGLYDRMAIILFSDHGEEHWEHGYWNHGHSVYDEVTRVPLFVKPPGARGGERRPQPVSTRRVFRTALELAGLQPGRCDQSVSLLYGSEGGADPNDAGLLIYSNDYKREPLDAVVWREWKTVRDVDRRLTVFDLGADPGESSPLPLDAEREARLAERLDMHLQAAAVQRACLGLDGDGTAEDMDPRTIERLRGLGYLQ